MSAYQSFRPVTPPFFFLAKVPFLAFFGTEMGVTIKSLNEQTAGQAEALDN